MGKIFGIGLGKTGTTSLCEALAILGYRAIHLPKLSYMDVFDAAADLNVAIAYKELDIKYPGSKFILTERPIEEWVDSQEKHFKKSAKLMGTNKEPFRTWRIQMYDEVEFTRSKRIEAYKRHRTDVTEYFANRPEDLLNINICDSSVSQWDIICQFLGKPIPNEPFPCLNVDGACVRRLMGEDVQLPTIRHNNRNWGMNPRQAYSHNSKVINGY